MCGAKSTAACGLLFSLLAINTSPVSASPVYKPAATVESLAITTSIPTSTIEKRTDTCTSKGIVYDCGPTPTALPDFTPETPTLSDMRCSVSTSNGASGENMFRTIEKGCKSVDWTIALDPSDSSPLSNTFKTAAGDELRMEMRFDWLSVPYDEDKLIMMNEAACQYGFKFIAQQCVEQGGKPQFSSGHVDGVFQGVQMTYAMTVLDLGDD